jgi:hypothetical protein
MKFRVLSNSPRYCLNVYSMKLLVFQKGYLFRKLIAKPAEDL